MWQGDTLSIRKADVEYPRYFTYFIEGPMADGGVDTIVGLYVDHPNVFTKFLVWMNFMWIDGHGHTQYIVKTPEAAALVKTGVITEVCKYE